MIFKVVHIEFQEDGLVSLVGEVYNCCYFMDSYIGVDNKMAVE